MMCTYMYMYGTSIKIAKFKFCQYLMSNESCFTKFNTLQSYPLYGITVCSFAPRLLPVFQHSGEILTMCMYDVEAELFTLGIFLRE